ncbi:MAG: hypothetical protein EBU12_10140 [Microbacteriaceae bacterium]|nr:hypothetical protein [Microbacteriaceae bacterium]
MRTAAICPTCATYENALCVLYNGEYLTNTDIQPLDSLEVALQKINNNLVPTTSAAAPAVSAVYRGQFHVNTIALQNLYFAKTVGLGAADWGLVLTTATTGAPEYADNTAAVVAGLTVGQIYRTGDVLKIVH